MVCEVCLNKTIKTFKDKRLENVSACPLCSKSAVGWVRQDLSSEEALVASGWARTPCFTVRYRPPPTWQALRGGLPRQEVFPARGCVHHRDRDRGTQTPCRR